MNGNHVLVAMWLALSAVGVAVAFNVKSCETLDSSVACVKAGGQWVQPKGERDHCEAKKP